MAYVAISRVTLRKHWGRDCPTSHFHSFCACVYNRCLPIRGEDDHLFALYESILKRMTCANFFVFFLNFLKKSPNSPGWTLSCLPLAIPTRTERLFPMYMVWFSGRPLYHLPANTPGKKTFLIQLQYCFLLMTWYPKSKKTKTMNKTSTRTTTIK